jgi:hypothetical protein
METYGMDPEFMAFNQLRHSAPWNDPRQAQWAPLEHRAFSRGVVKDNPWMAAPLAVATPAYALYKALGLKPQSTPPSWDQVKAGYQGIWEGLTR